MIGKLRHRVQLQSEVETADGGGGYANVWTTQATVSAGIKPLTGSEQLRGMRPEGKVSHRIRIRYRNDLSPTTRWRVLYGARAFNIRAVINEDERNRFWVLLCDEGVAT